MTYAALAEGLDESGLKDLDYALEAGADAPPTRQRGARALMGVLGATGRERR